MHAKQRTESDVKNADASRQEAALEQIRQALQDLRYGAVTIIVQDGVVIQIERTEKVRLRR